MPLTRSGPDDQIAAPLTRRRYEDGVSPQNWVKARVKELRLSKPTAFDVFCTDCPGAASKAIARSMRACRRYVRHDSPIVSWNWRRKARSETDTAD